MKFKNRIYIIVSVLIMYSCNTSINYSNDKIETESKKTENIFYQEELDAIMEINKQEYEFNNMISAVGIKDSSVVKYVWSTESNVKRLIESIKNNEYD